MRMYDAGKIITGLLIFLCLITSPIWYNLAMGKAAIRPDPKLPAKETECVAPKATMVATHMAILNDWRDDVVRGDAQEYVSPTGKRFTMSLSQGCMRCHPNKAEFCDQCHNYVDVSPYCWQCHVEPKEKK